MPAGSQASGSLIATLRASRFIRSSGSSERIETYHDRIRDVLTATSLLTPRREIHGRIVKVLVERGSDDCEALFERYHGAGDKENAAIQAGLAAGQGGHRARVRPGRVFLQHALALDPASTSVDRWREGFAVRSERRPPDRGRCGLHAGRGWSHRPARVELQRRGAEQFLIGGYIDRGLDQIRTMLADLGMSAREVRVPRCCRCCGGVHDSDGAGCTSRRERPTRSTPTHSCVDACWSAATGLLLVDMISAVAISARHLLVALDAGEPYRLARAMALESMARAAYPSGRALSRRLVEQSKELAKSVGHPHAIGLSRLADAMIAISLGQWKSALAVRGRARIPCGGVRGGHVGTEHGAERRDLGPRCISESWARCRDAFRLDRQRPQGGNLYSPQSCAPGATTSGWRQTILMKASASRSRASGDGPTPASIVSTTARCWPRIQTALYRG